VETTEGIPIDAGKMCPADQHRLLGVRCVYSLGVFVHKDHDSLWLVTELTLHSKHVFRGWVVIEDVATTLTDKVLHVRVGGVQQPSTVALNVYRGQAQLAVYDLVLGLRLLREAAVALQDTPRYVVFKRDNRLMQPSDARKVRLFPKAQRCSCDGVFLVECSQRPLVI